MRRCLKKALLIVSLGLLGGSYAIADQVAITKFGLLNNNSPSVAIDPTQAQDLLNVDATPGGLSVKKRFGYGTYKTLATSQAIHGGYHFFDSSGNDVQIWGSSTSLYGIVSDGTPTQLVSSATLNSTWDCADTQASAYCVDSNRDAFLKTNGTTKTWYTAPLGTMVEATPDRVVVAGVSASPNTLFVSQSNTFTNFTVGTLATDPFNEVIASPGSKLTHIRWGCGKLLWWKDASFGYFDFDDQFSAQVKIVSDVIGTFDNTSAIDPGGNVWFRGQDGHTWKYDCSILTKETIDITPNIQLEGKRVSNSWTQTSQSDFQGGSAQTGSSVSFAISPGDVVPSSWTVTENSSAQWNSGTTNNTTVNSNSITLSTNNSGNVTNNDMESVSSGILLSNWDKNDGSYVRGSGLIASDSCVSTISGWHGTFFAVDSLGEIGGTLTASIIDPNSGSTISSQGYSESSVNCTFATQTFAVDSSNIGKRVKFKFSASDGTNIHSIQTSESYILGGNITFLLAVTSPAGGTTRAANIDNVLNGSSTITSGSFTSQAFDTTFTSATYQLSNFAWTANTSTPTFSLQTSTANPSSNWVSLLTSSGTNAIGNRYARYTSTISVGGADNALTAITAATIVAKSSASYYSAVHNAPNLTSWSTFGANSQNDAGSQAFFLRSSTSSFTTLSSTPSWTSQSAGSLISISTGTYFQVRDDFTTTYATSTLALNDFTFNWFEGNASDQSYMLYFDNAIWESVAFGAGQASNNYIFKYDLINQGWTLYNFGAGGMLVQTNTLYFGDTSTGGKIFNFGTVKADNGTAINAYWKSKDFSGIDPFLQNQLTNIDVFAKKDSGSTLTSTYTTDTSTSTTYSISLSTANAVTQSRKLLPSGKLGYTFNIKLSDTSTASQWEVYGIRIGYMPQPYRASQ